MSRIFMALMLITVIITMVAAAAPSSSPSSSSLLERMNQASNAGTFRASATKINATLPVGVPLAGYNHGHRRVKNWPLPQPTKYTFWMTPSVGVMDDTWIRCLMLDDGTTRVAFLAFDGIGMDGGVASLGYQLASQRGLTLSRDNIIMSGSHSHSGPGGVSGEHLWEVAPATDKLVPELQHAIASSMADALIKAEQSLAPAVISIDTFDLFNVTRNRRAPISPYVKDWDVDSQLGLFRVDYADGRVMSTLWNFPIHGTCYGDSNMLLSGDIMGKVNDYIERTIGGISQFHNGDAGDIAPGSGMCQQAPDFAGARIIADKVLAWRKGMTPVDTITIKAASQIVHFGDANLNLTLARMANCTHGGMFNICSICEVLHCHVDLKLGDDWVENAPRFAGFHIDLSGKKIAITSIPGEAIQELGRWIKADGKALGYDRTLLFGYSNSHMGYFTTPREYDVGGYESQLTLFGYHTASLVQDGCKKAMTAVL